MPIEAFTTSRVYSSSVNVAFGAYIARDVALGIESGYGLVSTGGGVAVWLDRGASIIGENASIFLGLESGFRGKGHTLNVAEDALLHGFIDAGAILHGIGTVVQNAGTIRGLHYGLTIGGDGSESSNTVINTGLIEASLYYGFLAGGTARTDFENAGTIKGGRGSYQGGAGVDRIENTGSMLGGVKTSTGNDFIDTRLGIVLGTIDLGDGADTLLGSASADVVLGGAGDDRLVGSAGKDSLTGGLGRDKMTGSGGADLIVFTLASETGQTKATADIITDFKRSQSDRIDLGGIDANGLAEGDQAFKFVGKKAFSGTLGEVRYSVGDGKAFVFADLDGDRVADFCLQMNGVATLAAADFIL
jgi:Ca2+-binding RTX toxin-like protein